MNYKICTDFPEDLLLEEKEPSVSIYMPTHRLINDNKKDIIVFKNLTKDIIESLRQKYSNKDISPLVSKFKLMEDDFELWNHSKDGLAIFANLDEMIIYRLEKDLQPISLVSTSFHIKPLIQYFQKIEEYTILALELESFKLYRGNNLELKPIELPEKVKTTLTEALGSQHTENYHTHGGYGGAGDGSVFHGHGGKSKEAEIDRIRFFRHVDKVVIEEVSKKDQLPLILVALKEHHYDFKNISNNNFLLEYSIEGSCESFKEEELKSELKKINEERFFVRINQIIEKYHNLRNKELSSDQLIIVLKALLASRLDVLLIEANKIIPGRIDIEKQQIIESDLNDLQTDDLLDDMVQYAFQTGTKVYVLDSDKMPTVSGVAGIFRY
jgi:hypothetical protein